MTTDYSTSRFENALAEKAYQVVLDGFSDDSIYDGETMIAFDKVFVEDHGWVILRYDSQGFVWIEFDTLSGSGYRGLGTVGHWDYLRSEYERDTDD